MITIYFVTFYFASILFFIAFLYFSGARLQSISITNFLIIYIIFSSFVGLPVLFFQLDSYRVATGIDDKYVILELTYLSALNILFLILGLTLTKATLVRRSVIRGGGISKKLGLLQLIALCTMLVLCIAVLAKYLAKIDNIALVEAVTSGAVATAKARSKMGNDFGSDYHWYKLVMYDVGLFICFVCFANWLTVPKKGSLFLLACSISYSTFTLLMSAEKAPFAWLIIGLCIVYFLVRNEGKVPLRSLIKITAALLLILIIVFSIVTRAESASSAIFSVLSRALTGTISAGYYYLEYFPKYEEYKFGATLPNPGGLFPFNPYNYTTELAEFKFPKKASMGIRGSMPTTFWGESYVNFGPLGIPFIAFVVGVVIGSIDHSLRRLGSDPIAVGFYAWAILHFKALATSGFGFLLADSYFVVLLIIVIFLRTLACQIKSDSGLGFYQFIKR